MRSAQQGYGWRVQFATMVVPLVVYGFMFFGQTFPQTERVEQGVSTGDMFAACLRPGFLLMVACMVLTAATELGPAQWIPNILSNAGVSGILVLVWITGLMAVGRMFAGPFVHSLSPIGMLTASAVLSALGLYAMSHSTGAMLFAAATLFAFGVCFFWPTMLGFVAENYPKTGALGLAIMGGVGHAERRPVRARHRPVLRPGSRSPAASRRRTRRSRCRSCRRPASTRSARWSIAAGDPRVVFVLIAVMRKKPATVAAPAHG